MHCTQKRSFPLKISSVNEEILMENFIFCAVMQTFFKNMFSVNVSIA